MDSISEETALLVHAPLDGAFHVAGSPQLGRLGESLRDGERDPGGDVGAGDGIDEDDKR